MLNATYTDPDVEVVDVENGVPSIILLLSMIDEGNVTRIDQIHYFIDPLVLHVDQLIAVSIDVIIYLYTYIDK